MIALELLWWVGWVYLAAWTALPLAAVPIIGPVAGLLLWALLAPWSALFGMALLHRLLPRSEEGVFRMFSDPGSVRWALKGWAPGVFLTVFQPVWFMSQAFARTALLAFGARVAPDAWLTSRTIIREPHRVTIGAGTMIGEYAHLVCSFQPKMGLLVVGDIRIGERVLVGAYSQIGPGAVIGSDTRLEHRVTVGPQTMVGAGCRIGAASSIYNSARIGDGVTIGKGCLVPSGSIVPAGTTLADGTTWAPPRAPRSEAAA